MSRKPLSGVRCSGTKCEIVSADTLKTVKGMTPLSATGAWTNP